MITPDGLLFLQSFGVAAAIYIAWIVWQLVANNGMASRHSRPHGLSRNGVYTGLT